MKCSIVNVIFNKEDAKAAGLARLNNPEDLGVTTQEQADNYNGVTFVENAESTDDLHLVYRDGFACVNFIDEEGVRVNYDYPVHSIKRVKHKSNWVRN